MVILFFLAIVSKAQEAKEFILNVEDFEGEIQWEQSTDRKIWNDVPNGNVVNIRLFPSETTLYRAKITDPGCSPIYSDIKAAYYIGDTVIGAKMIEGKVILPAESSVELSSLKAMSYLEEVDILQDGSFYLLLPDSVEEDVLIINNNKDEVVMLGHYVGIQESYTVTPEITAEALIIMYPALKPIPIHDKIKFKKLYKEEAEFKKLVSDVSTLNIDGIPLFSDQNTALINTLSILVQKSFNEERLRLSSTDPIYIYSPGDSRVEIDNTTFVSYTGQIYKIDGDNSLPVGPKFNIAGSMIKESSFAQQFIKDVRRRDINVQKSQVIIDLLNTFHGAPGEYEIVVRNGLADDNTPEDNEAFKQNLWEMTALSISNFASWSLGIDNACLANIIDAHANAINPNNILDATNNSVFPSYILPILKDILKSGVNCYSENKAALRAIKIIDLVDKSLPIAWYGGSWKNWEPAIEGCQYLSDEGKTSNCFVIERAVELDPHYFPGDTVELKIKTIDNKDYYPYKGEEAAFRHMFWVADNGSEFLPNNSVFESLRTDINGEASIKFVLSCDPGANYVSIKAALTGTGSTLKFRIFNISTKVNALKIIKAGDYQQGESGKELSQPITFSIQDLTDGLLTKLNRFNIKWEVFRDGNWQEISGQGTTIKNNPNLSGKEFIVSKIWTLDDVDGEQTVRATIKDKCEKNWNIEDNPVIFTANFRNPWIDSLLGKWSFERYTEFSDAKDYKDYVDVYEASRPLNKCAYTYEPIGNNTIHYTDFPRITQEFIEDEVTGELTFIFTEEMYKSISHDCDIFVWNTGTSAWSVTNTGKLYSSTYRPINAQLERIDDDTFRGVVCTNCTGLCLYAPCAPIKLYYILTRIN